MDKVQRTQVNNQALPKGFSAAGLMILCSLAACLACWPVIKDASPFVYILPFVLSFASIFTYGNKSSFVTVTASTAALVVFTSVIQYKNFINGAKLFANRLFELSEESQAYVYNMFEITQDSPGLDSRTVFAIFVTYLITILTIHASLKRVSAVHIAFIVIYAEAEIYLGIQPGALINALMFTAWFMLAVFAGLIGAGKQQKAAFQMITITAAMLLAVSALTYFAYPAKYREQHPVVHETGEKIRDLFDESVTTILEKLGILPEEEQEEEVEQNDNEENEAEDPEDMNENEDEAETEPPPPPDEPNGEGGQEELPTDIQTGGQKKEEKKKPLIFYILLIILLLILAYIAALVIVNVIKNKKMRSENTKEAVVYTFTRSVKWLRKAGFEENNIPMLWRAKEISELVSPEFAKQYGTAVADWEEALYSTEEIDISKKEKMIEYFLSAKKEAVSKTGKLKYIYYKMIRFM